VRAVDVRVDQAHGQRLDTRVDEVAHDALDLLAIDGRDSVAVRVEPLDRLACV
jgi:hypothetical protein